VPQCAELMLLAVEGGGFFSSSASGYSKGLTLLLLGQKNEDKPMRVSPWNQYRLVDQESDPNLQLASTKNWLPRGCASFVCFGRASAGLDTSSALKVGPAHQQDVLPGPLVSDKGKDCTTDQDDDSNARKVALKSSLKKPSNKVPVLLTMLMNVKHWAKRVVISLVIQKGGKCSGQILVGVSLLRSGNLSPGMELCFKKYYIILIYLYFM
jgi:hypothetical protein